MAGTKRCRDGDGDGRSLDRGRDGDNANSTSILAALRQEADTRPRKRSRMPTILLGRRASTTGRGLSSPPPAFPALCMGTDYLSPLSDELLVRILGYLSLTSLLSLAPVSRRFHRLADDSQLWKAVYHERFVLPRAMRIPGSRGSSLENPTRATTGSVSDTALRGGSSGDLGAIGVSRRRVLGNEGALTESPSPTQDRPQDVGTRTSSNATTNIRGDRILNWKQQYKLRHNWARGKCAVAELRLGSSRCRSDALDMPNHYGQDEEEDEDDNGEFHRILVKVVDGIAVTADRWQGLRVWELKSRSMVARGLFVGRTTQGTEKRRPKESAVVDRYGKAGEDHTQDEAESSNSGDAEPPVPTSLAVDVTAHVLDIAIGLHDGDFDVWQLDLIRKTLVRRFSHAASSSGPLTGIAYSHPYVLTATDNGLVSLHAFAVEGNPAHRLVGSSKPFGNSTLSAPHLLTSLRSHTSRPPLALSIRKLASVTVASIAYTFSTRQGWSIGIQDLHVKAAGPGESKEKGTAGRGLPTVVTTRLAYTLPVSNHGKPTSSAYAPRREPDTAFSNPPRSRRSRSAASVSASVLPFGSPLASVRAEHRRLQRQQEDEDGRVEGGPTTLCYTHPYLLATMPDNTLILHLCTSNASTLAISAGIRLWGHTSGISDAEITARGKAVSVSMRGEEMRLWELEGRPAAERGRSVAIRPNVSDANVDGAVGGGGHDDGPGYDWDERRNWVGFDDEMVIVLKESRGGRESLMVYDFT